MQHWLKLPRIGAGTDIDPYRPDLSGIGKVEGWCAVYSGDSCLVLVESKTAPAGHLTTVEAVRGEAVKLGMMVDWAPVGYAIGTNEGA